MNYILSPDAFLGWHIFLELISIIMSFSIFTITYYTYEHSNKISSIIFACTFFATSILDIFHLHSYKGMPFFLTNPAVAKATTYWIIARFTMSLGILAATLIPQNKTVKTRKIFILIPVIICLIILCYLVNTNINIFPKLYIEGHGLTKTKIYSEYVIIALLIISAIINIYRYNKKKHHIEYNLALIVGLLASIISEASFTVYVNVYDIYNFIGHILKIIAYYLFFRALFVINVKEPYYNLNEAERKLSNYANDLENMVAERTYEIEKANRKLEQDLDYARNIQLALLPNSFPDIEGMEFAARYLPCEKVGGDFYNIYKLDDENIGILIGDVAGHGVSAAMVNVFINQNIFIKKEYDDGRYKIFTPRGVLMNLYHIYNKMPFPEDIYLVMLYGIYNTRTHEFSYSSAGINIKPIILSSSGNVKTIELEGFPICKFGKYFKPYYETKTILLEPEDTLIFYTDGLVDIDRNRPQLLAYEDLLEFVRGTENMSALDICEDITDAYFTLLNEKKMLDDVTVLVIKTNK